MKKKFVTFQSIFSQEIKSYLEYKRALGYKFISEESALRLFDRFLVAIDLTDMKHLTATKLADFLVSRPRKRPRSYNHLLGVLQCFFAWLVAHRRLDKNPMEDFTRKKSSQGIPFLFKPAQFKQLLKLACSLSDKGGVYNRGAIYSTIFTLMYSLGLRVGEASRLCYKDVDFQRKLLIIRETKFGKSRLVPFGPKLEMRIYTYLNHKKKWSPEDPLFSFRKKRAIHPCTITQMFHQLIKKLVLPIPPGVESPCLYCLRHSFVVETLLHWYKNDIDPNSRLFHLSTFLGHVDPVSTAWYLTITDELLEVANKRFEKMVAQTLPGGSL